MVMTSTLVPATALQRIQIAAVVLSINPQSVQETQPAQVTYLPGLTGAIRQDFGNGPHAWTLEGHTGQGGRDALQSIQKLRDRTGPQLKPVPFLYPYKYGSRVFQVYVDDCTWAEQMGETGWLFQYTILLREAVARSTQPPILRVQATGGAGGTRTSFGNG